MDLQCILVVVCEEVNMNQKKYLCILYVNYGSERFPYAWTDNVYMAKSALETLRESNGQDSGVELYDMDKIDDITKQLYPLFGVDTMAELKYYYKLVKVTSMDNQLSLITLNPVKDKYFYDVDLKLDIAITLSENVLRLFYVSDYMIDKNIKSFIVYIIYKYISCIYVAETLDAEDLMVLFDIVKIMNLDKRYLFEL